MSANEEIKDHKVSIIIPTYGRPEKLEKCLLSLNTQKYKNFEVVLVDDNGENSENGSMTEARVSKLKSKINYSLNYIKLKENQGACIARNEGVKASSSDFITFLDDDDEYLEDKIEKQIAFMLTNDLDLSLCGMHINKNGKFLESHRCYPIGDNLKDFVYDGNAVTAMIMVKKSLFEKVGGFTVTKKYQDHILMFKFLEQKPKVGFLNEKLYIYNIHNDGNISKSKKVYDSILLRHKYEEKWVYLLSKSEKEYISNRQLGELLIYSPKGKNIFNILFKSGNNISFNLFYVISKSIIKRFIS